MSWGVATQNGVSVSLASIVSLSAGVTEFSPADLFTSGVQGAWYDPSDYSTLFQDSAGTTPVTAVEQPVRLMLDKSQGLVLGSEATSGAWLNGYTTTFDTFTSTGPSSFTATTTGAKSPRVAVLANLPTAGWYWIEFTATFTGGLFTGSGFANTGNPYSAVVVTTVLPTSGVLFRTLIYTSAPREYLALIFLASGASTLSVTGVSVKSYAGNHALAPNDASRPVLRARYNILLATDTLATQSVTTLATTYKLSFTGAGTITLSGTATGTYSAGTNTITCTAGTLTLTVSGTVTNADLRLSSTSTAMPAYQSVVTSTNYVTTGFLPYLSLDGTDDSFSTGSINFSATDKMSVCAGVTKLSDAAAGTLIELTADATANNGGFALRAPDSATSDYGAITRGTVASNTRLATTYAAPITNVLTTLLNNGGALSADQITVRINAATPTLSAGTATTAGNFANAAMYIGRRNNATVPFNGRIYQMVVCGKTLSAAELASTEAYVATKTGVTL